jgi:hypothetical protein
MKLILFALLVVMVVTRPRCVAPLMASGRLDPPHRHGVVAGGGCAALFASSSSSSNGNETVSADSVAIVPTAQLQQQQAEKLRAEAALLQQKVLEAKQTKLQRQRDKTDRQMHELLIAVTVDENTELLHSVDRIVATLIEHRYSYEQVTRIFDRICELHPDTSRRSRCAEILTNFVDACGQLDCMERSDNPNKRWNGKVERNLRKRLFARDWGMDLEDDSTASESTRFW